MKKLLTLLLILIITALFIGCKKVEEVPEVPPKTTAEDISEVEESISEIETLEEELDISELETLEEELGEVTW